MALWLQLEFKSLALPLMVFDTNTVNSCGGVVHIIVPALAIPLKKGTFDLNHGRYSLSKPRDQVYSHGAKPRRPPLRGGNAFLGHRRAHYRPVCCVAHLAVLSRENACFAVVQNEHAALEVLTGSRRRSIRVARLLRVGDVCATDDLISRLPSSIRQLFWYTRYR